MGKLTNIEGCRRKCILATYVAVCLVEIFVACSEERENGLGRSFCLFLNRMRPIQITAMHTLFCPCGSVWLPLPFTLAWGSMGEEAQIKSTGVGHE